MRLRSVHAAAVVFGLAIGACSPTSTPTPSPSSNGSGGRGGSTQTGSGGSGGTSASGSGGSTTGTGGSTSGATGGAGGGAGGGNGGNAGNAGNTGTGGSSTTGAGGSGGSTSGDSDAGNDTRSDSSGTAPDSPSAGSGMQTAPGIEGDGTFPQPPPYTLPPESRMQVNGAPKGQLIGPIVHTLKGTYASWSAWKFSYWIYVPAQYKPGKAAALMVFQDGSLYVGAPFTDARFNAPTVFDNLIHEGAMPITIGVFIDAGSSNGQHVGGGDAGRSRQYDTPSDVFGKFVLNEFLPENVLNKYTIVSDPDGWGTGGHSSGGIAAFMMAWYYPDKFRKVVTASPSFSNTRGVFPAEVLKVMPPKPIRVYHLSGTQDLGGWLQANTQAAANFKQMGYHHRFRPGQDIHYPPAAAAADFPDALRWLWRGYKLAP